MASMSTPPGGSRAPGVGVDDRVWMADRARECGLVLEADAFQRRLRMPPRRTRPNGPASIPTPWSAAPIPHDRLTPPCATDPAGRRKGPRHEYVANTAVDRHHRGRRYASAGLIEYLDAGGPVDPGRRSRCCWTSRDHGQDLTLPIRYRAEPHFQHHDKASCLRPGPGDHPGACGWIEIAHPSMSQYGPEAARFVRDEVPRGQAGQSRRWR